MPRGVRDGKRVRLERLHEYAPGRIAAAPAGKLRQELERPFLGPEVGQPQPRVGVDDGGERNAAEVVTLGHHLRADEHGAVGGREPPQRIGNGSPAPCGVGVEPDSLELGNPPFELPLEPLGARAEAYDVGRSADRTRLG